MTGVDRNSFSSSKLQAFICCNMLGSLLIGKLVWGQFSAVRNIFRLYDRGSESLPKSFDSREVISLSPPICARLPLEPAVKLVQNFAAAMRS